MYLKKSIRMCIINIFIIFSFSKILSIYITLDFFSLFSWLLFIYVFLSLCLGRLNPRICFFLVMQVIYLLMIFRNNIHFWSIISHCWARIFNGFYLIYIHSLQLLLFFYINIFLFHT